MEADSNKEKVRDFLLKGLGERDLTVVDRVFSDNHILSSPAIGTEEAVGTDFVKSAIEDLWSEEGEVWCSVEDQCAEGPSVATSYTLSGELSDHKGIMISYFAEGKITRSVVVAREVGGSAEDLSARRKVFN